MDMDLLHTAIHTVIDRVMSDTDACAVEQVTNDTINISFASRQDREAVAHAMLKEGYAIRYVALMDPDDVGLDIML